MKLIFVVVLIIIAILYILENKKRYESNTKLSSFDLDDDHRPEQTIVKRKDSKSHTSVVLDYELPTVSIIKNEKSQKFKKAIECMATDKKLCFIVGRNSRKNIYESITRLPNLLVGGTVMTGKTSYIHSIICSLLLKEKPDHLRLIIVDSKGVDYQVYRFIPHLFCPIITDPKEFYKMLDTVVDEINKRYQLLRRNDSKDIEEYNTFYNKEKEKVLPYIVIIIDELMSMLLSNQDNNKIIEQVGQLGWTVGIHIIAVLNHPSSNIITTLAKSNFTARAAFRTVNMRDSRMIMNKSGAEKLNFVGNFLYSSLDHVELLNLKVPFISDDDIQNIVNFLKKYTASSQLINEYVANVNDEYSFDDPIYNDIVKFVITVEKVSASLLQKKFKLGYNRAARMIDILEERGIVGPQKGIEPREVLIRSEENK